MPNFTDKSNCHNAPVGVVVGEASWCCTKCLAPCDLKPLSGSGIPSTSKVTTIEEVLDEFGNYLYDLHLDRDTGATMNRRKALATIEQLVLERVIGRDMSVGDEIEEGRSYTGERLHNRIKAEQRAKLKQLLGREDHR